MVIDLQTKQDIGRKYGEIVKENTRQSPLNVFVGIIRIKTLKNHPRPSHLLHDSHVSFSMIHDLVVGTCQGTIGSYILSLSLSPPGMLLTER